ncbi:MAG: hypothetical protein ABIG87_00315 [Patescibacteria group bacterium]
MKKIILSLSLALPLITLAATSGLKGVMGTLSDLMGVAMPLLLSAAVLFFVYSLVLYMLKDGEEKTKAKENMIWGVVILFVMVSVWGLVNVLGDTFNLDTAVPSVDWEVR